MSFSVDRWDQEIDQEVLWKNQYMKEVQPEELPGLRVILEAPHDYYRVYMQGDDGHVYCFESATIDGDTQLYCWQLLPDLAENIREG